MFVPLSLVLAAALARAPHTPPPDCQEWHECRQMALDARAQHEYERFHDLAWRTVQTGPPRDPALMYLLARAQALSGRADDALVMLERIAGMGVAADAANEPDFDRLRSDARWTRLCRTFVVLAAYTKPYVGPNFRLRPGSGGLDEARRAKSVSSAARNTKDTKNTNTKATKETKDIRGTTETNDTTEPAGRTARTPEPVNPGTREPGTVGHIATEEALPMPATSFVPAALAYDQVSARFVLADSGARRLVVIDEQQRHLVDLVDADSAGFGDITALEIDPRRGDLWVVSADAGDGHAGSVLHKLQLVSGRPLQVLPLPESFGPARFADVAVGREGDVFVLDALGGRVFRVAAGSKRFEVAARLELEGPVSIAPAAGRTMYVAGANRIDLIDLGAAGARALSGPHGFPLGGFERIRADRSAIAGVQRLPDGSRRVVSLELDGAGRRVTRAAVADPNAGVPTSSAAAISGHAFYYVAADGSPEGAATTVVRRVEMP